MLTYVKQLVWTVPIAIAANDLIASVMRVDGPSMQPTLNPDLSQPSDWVLVEKISYKWHHKYERGELAVLRYDATNCCKVAYRVGAHGFCIMRLKYNVKLQPSCIMHAQHACSLIP